MNSIRLQKIAEFISKKDIVLDVGCDHGYLSIYLKENNLCKNVYASDISSSALEGAIKNFEKHKLDIKNYVSDGFKNIPVKFNTAVLAGMGTSTILKIINSSKTPRKLIISSHNELYRLRKNLNKMNYTLKKEVEIYENGYYYRIMEYNYGKERLSKSKLKFGISNSKEYWNYLLEKNKDIIKKVPIKKKIKLYYDNFILKGLIRKK